MPIIELRGLTHIYNQGSLLAKKALDNINVCINQGECIGLIGHTGSGKSTLIQHLNALLKPTSGHVLVKGENINANKKNLKKIREQVGLVFQYPEHQLFELTVYQDVAFGPTNMGLKKDEIDQRVREALAMVGLEEESIHKKSPFELSGGQKRRAAIAGVLAMRPDVLILDEPTAGLDPSGRDEILMHIQHLYETYGNTVILVSHNMEDVAKLTNRILIMENGQIISDGTPVEIFSKIRLLQKVGLAVPQIVSLIYRLNEQGFQLPTHALTIPAAVNIFINAARDRGIII